MELYDEILGDNSSESGSGDFGADSARIFLPAVYGVIFLLGTVGNALVVAVMGFQRRSRTMTDKYRPAPVGGRPAVRAHAALLGGGTRPATGTSAASWCVAVHMIYTVNLYSSVLILAFISVDRYLAVVRATSSQDARKVLAQRVIYAGVWLPALLLTVPDLVFAKAEDVTVRTICERIYPPDSAVAWLVAFRVQHILVGFVVPGLVILTCYCVIIARLSSGTKGTQKRKALKTTVVLIVCFFGCWLPYCAGILVDTLLTLGVVAHSCALEQGLEKWISVTEALAYFHCCLNPILYAFLGAKFKKSARNALSPSRGSSLKILSRRRAGVPSISTESESSSFHSS
uniref:G-protein coupled receptors family 1 profile domain-containing protein n=1 Tax=Denticeps clupeoides TaxID=299321 RepID=A0AAY4CED1_9TELE